MQLKDYVLEQKDYITEMRRYFHAHPEVSRKEFQTCLKIEEELDRFGIPHKRIDETGVYAWIDGTKPCDCAPVSEDISQDEQNDSAAARPRVIVLRSDIDALAMDDLKTVPYRSENDGFCHACGHDGHAATLLGAARILKSKEDTFSGQVRLFFQHAEEIGHGARQFVKAGLMEGADRVFGAHVSSLLDVGTIALTAGPQNASCDYFKITVTGRGAHVSTPHRGVDAAYIASQIVVSLQSIVARTVDPLDTVVVGVGVIRAGTQYNIVAEHAQIEGTTRCFSHETRASVNEKVIRIAKQTAQMYGADAEVEFKDFASPLINDPGAVEEVTAVVSPLVGEDHIVSNFEKALGADDFADYLAVTKGTYAFVGTKSADRPGSDSAHHHGSFDMDETGLLLSCNAYVDYALWVLREMNAE